MLFHEHEKDERAWRISDLMRCEMFFEEDDKDEAAWEISDLMRCDIICREGDLQRRDECATIWPRLDAGRPLPPDARGRPTRASAASRREHRA